MTFWRNKTKIEDLLPPVELESPGYRLGVPPCPCPAMHKMTKACVCIDCSHRDSCAIERIARSSVTPDGRPCRQYVRSCNVRTSELSSSNSKFADLCMEEFEEFYFKEYDVKL